MFVLFHHQLIIFWKKVFVLFRRLFCFFIHGSKLTRIINKLNSFDKFFSRDNDAKKIKGNKSKMNFPLDQNELKYIFI